MALSLIVKSIAAGFIIAIPTGPVGAICVRTALAQGRMAGLVSGLGSALGDAFYVAVAEFGLTAVSSFIMSQYHWLHFVGCILITCLGLNIILKTRLSGIRAMEENRHRRLFVSTLLLSLVNPAILISLTALIASLGMFGDRGDYLSASVCVLGVFIGSSLWWIMLTGILDRLKGRFTEMQMNGASRITGFVITGFGLSALLFL